MDPSLLITDVDNTIADPSERMRRSLRETGREEVFEKTADRYGGFSDFLSTDEEKRLWEVFLSDRFLHLDEPVPGAAESLSRMVEDGLEVAYLTGRHDEEGDTMRPGTEAWLLEHGFPPPGERGVRLFMKPEREMDDKGFKLDFLEREFSPHSGRVVGVGDHPHDALAYSRAGIEPVMLDLKGLFSEEELKSVSESVVVVESWSKVVERLGV
ncbi:MAG: HAD family hydrolase [Candidatus Bipolaricaulota bacterium]